MKLLLQNCDGAISAAKWCHARDEQNPRPQIRPFQ